MTTPDAPQNSAEILVHKTGELTDKTTTLVTSVAETIGRRIRALDALRSNESITANPARMATIVDSLFAAADTLIYLAEDMRGVTQRTERSRVESKAPRKKVGDDELTTDEQELFDLLASLEGEAVSVEYLLESGYGVSISTDRTVRKRRLQKALDTLARKAPTAIPGQVLIKEGRTRGTKYSLVAGSEASGTSQHTQTDVAEQDTVAELEDIAVQQSSAPEEVHDEQPVPAQALPVPVAPVARMQEQKKDTALEELVDHTINTLLRMDEKRPYISIQDIISVGINGRHLAPEDFERLKVAVGNDHRLEHVAGPEYRIKGRDVNARWIDTGVLRQAADQFITNMVRWGSGEENLENLFKAIGRTQMRPTEPERSELIRLLKNDYRVVRVAEGSIIVDASRTEDDDPNKHLKGMSPAQLDKALGQLHMKGQSGFRRKR